MEYIETVDLDDIIRRTDLKHIRKFVLDMDGIDPDEIFNLTYNERLAEGCVENSEKIKQDLQRR